MIGIIIQLIISWLLLWYFDKSNLSALGIVPTKERLLVFCIGFALSAGVCAVYNLLTTAFADNGWTINQQLKVTATLKSIGWVFTSVFYEELIFRGALLYLAMKNVLAQAKPAYSLRFASAYIIGSLTMLLATRRQCFSSFY